MARTPRPVDPTEGPVQSFAHDLRLLREAAGNPTYRALARIAGFSATTLGDAAGGVRLPTLEVTLAYVGACGGDTEAWLARWQELNRLPAVEQRPAGAGADVAAAAEADSATAADEATDAAETADAPAAAGQVDVSGDDQTGVPSVTPSNSASSDTTGPADSGAAPSPAAENHGAPAPTALSRLRRRPVSAVVGVLVLIAAVLAWRLPAMDHPAAGPTTHSVLADANSTPTTAPPADCPASAPSPDTFPALTYEQATKVRTGASTDASVHEQISAGCTLRFTGYCLGEVVVSGYSASPDMRWFELSGGGLVSSAILHGDPTPGMKPSRCPGDVPPPASVALTATRGAAGTVTLQATGPDVWIAGFAAFYPGAPGETPQWHQLSIIDVAAPATVPQLTAADLASAPGAAGIPVVADACYGGGSPTSVYTADTLDPANPSALTPLTLSSADLAAAELKACSYPSTN